MATLVGALAAPLLIFAMALPCHADSMCKDGTTSTATGRGACSGHGGVQKAGKSGAAAAPASTESASPAAAPAPTAAASKAAPAASKSAPTASKSAPAAKSDATAGNTDPTGATAKCKDGTYSKSKHHKGSCSHHGGVAEFLTP